MVTLVQVNFFILRDAFNICHPSYESMSYSIFSSGAFRCPSFAVLFVGRYFETTQVSRADAKSRTDF